MLACAASNVAVDNVAERLLDAPSPPKIVRVGHPSRLLPSVQASRTESNRVEPVEPVEPVSRKSHTSLTQVSRKSHTSLTQVSHKSRTSLTQVSHKSHTRLTQVSHKSHQSHTSLTQVSPVISAHMSHSHLFPHTHTTSDAPFPRAPISPQSRPNLAPISPQSRPNLDEQGAALEARLARSEGGAIVSDVRRDLCAARKQAAAAPSKGGARRAAREEVKLLRKELTQRQLKATRELLSGAQVVLSTNTGAADRAFDALPAGHTFDLVVIDEAAQAGPQP